MRVLLINPATPESFWTFGRSIELLGRKALTPPLGLITVAALLPDHWEFRLVDLAARRLTDSDWDWADTVMFSAMIVQRESLLALTREAKARGKRVVAGGPYPTSLPHEPIEVGCDFLVRGEGESAVPLLLAALEEGKTRGVIESPDRPDLSTSPVPRFDLLNPDDYLTLSVQTSRGCPFDCEFCDIVNLYGRKPRYKSADQLIRELDAIRRLGWRREVFITDDNFIGNKDHARSILHELTPWMKRHGEPFSFWTQTSVDLGQDIELIDLMTEANFDTVFIGIESPDEEVLAANRKFQNIRSPLLESLNNINANGLSMVGSFVIGFDNEKPGAGERICAFVEEAGIPIVAMNLLQALPNTRLWDRLKKEGRLLAAVTSGQTTGSRMNFIPARPESEIVSEYLAAWDRLYEPSRQLDRAYRYFLNMRPTRAAAARERNGPARTLKPLDRPDTSDLLDEFILFLRFSWRRGVRSDDGLQYWKRLFGMYRKNPSRLVKFLSQCGLADNMVSFKEVVRQRLGEVATEALPS
jgi:radical SAM superfamily enzyme YgiQ (UPF0313 family)